MQQRLIHSLLLALVLATVAGAPGAEEDSPAPSVAMAFGKRGIPLLMAYPRPLEAGTADALFQKIDAQVSPPSSGRLQAGKQWTLSSFKSTLMRFSAKQNAALILYVRLVSPASRKIWMTTGSNGPIRARLGKSEVLTRAVSRKPFRTRI